jgi:hypothetical protein
VAVSQRRVPSCVVVASSLPSGLNAVAFTGASEPWSHRRIREACSSAPRSAPREPIEFSCLTASSASRSPRSGCWPEASRDSARKDCASAAACALRAWLRWTSAMAPPATARTSRTTAPARSRRKRRFARRCRTASSSLACRLAVRNSRSSSLSSGSCAVAQSPVVARRAPRKSAPGSRPSVSHSCAASVRRRWRSRPSRSSSSQRGGSASGG